MVQIRSNIGGRETANSRVPTPKPLRTRASRRGRVQMIALSTMRLDGTARGVSGGAEKRGEWSRDRPESARSAGRGDSIFEPETTLLRRSSL